MGRTSDLASTVKPHTALLFALGLAMGLPSGVTPVHARDSAVPWECSNYSYDAQTRCMQALIEAQRDKIGQLEGELQTQRSRLGTLQDEVDRQSRATSDLQRQLLDRPAVVPAPVPYPPFMYAYPPGIGFGLYLGRPHFYAAPYLYGGPFWGPRYGRHWRHRW